MIISIVLLSSPVVGDNHKDETLYRLDNPSGSGYLWKEFGDKNIQPIYKGEITNGEPNGVGVLTYPDGSNYEGEWKNGLPNGQGIDTYPNGQNYVGEWKNGLPNGRGTEILPDGQKYVGEWKDGKFHGQG